MLRTFIKKYGYESTDPAYALERLRSRLAQREDFPHEIGLFLGYPLGDVIGFIKNAGQNCKCVGCWKVYCNECEAIRLLPDLRNVPACMYVSGIREEVYVS